MSEGTITTKTLELTDGTEFQLDSYENIEQGMKFKVKELTFDAIKEQFTTDNLATVNVYSDMGEVVAILNNVQLGNSITLDTNTNMIELSLVNKDLESQVKDLKKTIEELQNQVNELQVQVENANTTEKEVEDNKEVAE